MAHEVDDTWTTAFEATPAGTDQGNVIDDRINELKASVRQRGISGGHIYTSDPDSDVGHGAVEDKTKDGRHVVEAGGTVGTSPNIYKSASVDDAVDTALVAYTDTLITMAEDLSLAKDIKGPPIEFEGGLAANATSSRFLGGHSDRDVEQDLALVDTNVPFGDTTVMVTGSDITLSQQGTSGIGRCVFVILNVGLYPTTQGTNAPIQLDLEVSTDSGSNWSQREELIGQTVDFLVATGATGINVGHTHVTRCIIDVIDTAAAPTRAYRVKITNNDGSVDVHFFDPNLIYFELWSESIGSNFV